VAGIAVRPPARRTTPPSFPKVYGAAGVGELVPELTGAFYSPELEACARFLARDESLRLEIHGPYGYSAWGVRPVTRDLLVLRHEVLPAWTAVVILERIEDRVTGLQLSTRRTRQLEFVRRGGLDEFKAMI